MASEFPIGVSALLNKLDEVIGAITQLRNRLERPAPTVWRSPFPQNHTQLRVEWWLVTVDAAGTYSLVVGSSTVFTVQVGSASLSVIPLPITIPNAADISITATGGNVTDSALIGYTE